MSRIEVSPFHRKDRTLAGFVMSGRWPETTREWTQLLAVTVQVAAQPGFLNTTTVFRATVDLPEDPHPGTVGLVAWAGPVIGDQAPAPGSLANPLPPAVFVLHPPSETVPSTPENDGAASGAILLPGVPHLGLKHRAGWVEADADGTVTKLLSGVDVVPDEDPDLAVLATLCAA